MLTKKTLLILSSLLTFLFTNCNRDSKQTNARLTIPHFIKGDSTLTIKVKHNVDGYFDNKAESYYDSDGIAYQFNSQSNSDTLLINLNFPGILQISYDGAAEIKHDTLYLYYWHNDSIMCAGLDRVHRITYYLKNCSYKRIKPQFVKSGAPYMKRCEFTQDKH